jgi:uncharacterized protein
MGERMSYAPGTFCWADLTTPAQDAAKTFYAALLGWSYDDRQIGGGMTYSIAQVDGHGVAAVSPPSEADEVARWSCYVSVEDADVAAARAAELGAMLVAEPFDVLDAGRMASFVDPQGASLLLWQGKQRIGATLVNEIGTMTWNDLLTPDIEASRSFYGQLFGWTIEATAGAQGQYWTIRNGGRLNGGMLPAPPGMPPAWNTYFAVEDADASLARAIELGADTVLGPIDVPNGTRFVVLRDPQGAVVCLGAGPREP